MHWDLYTSGELSKVIPLWILFLSDLSPVRHQIRYKDSFSIRLRLVHHFWIDRARRDLALYVRVRSKTFQRPGSWSLCHGSPCSESHLRFFRVFFTSTTNIES